MSELQVRRLLIDLEPDFARHWADGDAFRTAFFNALSLSFPWGEQFFIDSVRNGLKKLSPDQQLHWEQELRGFIGQEATHRRLHALFNRHIEAHGCVNHWEARAMRRIEKIRDADPRIHVAVTASTEHFTAIFAEWLLSHREVLANSEPRLRNLWHWHCAEEAEHRSTAFELYRAMGGDEVWRLRVFRLVTFDFLRDLAMQTLSNLKRDRSLWKWSTWKSGWALLFAKDGLIRGSYPAWRSYMRPDFHPDHYQSDLSGNWLRDNSAVYSIVGSSTS